MSRVAHGSTVEAALRPYRAAIRKGDGSTSDPASLDATVFLDRDRVLVDVRMGYASSVSAFGREGRLSVPSAARWSCRQFGPFFRAGALVVFDATSLSDAGVRYAFRLAFLHRTKMGYVAAGTANGESTYDFDDKAAPRLVAKGRLVKVRSLDPPRSFFVSNADDLLRREETWSTAGPVARRVGVRLLDPDVRAVDAWLWAHRGGMLAGKRTLPREPAMAEEIRRGKGWVALSLDGLALRFTLAFRGGKNVVTKVTAIP